MTEKPTLAARLAAIMGECESIPKNGLNKEFNYKFIREADISAAIRKLLAKHGVAMISDIIEVQDSDYTTSNGKHQTYCRIKIKYTFINTDDPTDTYSTVAWGDGIDGQDKGIYKASTGAHKFMLRRFFCLGADEDPENDDRAVETGHRRPAAQRVTSRPVRPDAPDEQQHGYGPIVPEYDSAEGPPFVPPDADAIAAELAAALATDDPSGFAAMDDAFVEEAAQRADEAAYQIPFKEKDLWKPILSAAGHRWHGATKTWRGGRPIPEMERFRVQ
jgi:hypothetical protein